MAKNRRRSVLSDMSSRNQGDQPLSPPTDTSFILTPQPQPQPQQPPQNPPQAGRPPSYRQLARNIAFSFSDDSLSSSQISNDPYASELAVTWNYHEGRKGNAPSIHQFQESEPLTKSETSGHSNTIKNEASEHSSTTKNEASGYSNTTLQVDEGSATQAQSTCLPVQFRQKAVSFSKRQMIWAFLSVITTLGYLLVITERMGLAHPSLLRGVGSFSVLFSGLPGMCLACMCYMGTIWHSKRKAFDAACGSASVLGSTAQEPPSELRVEKNFDVSDAFHELRRKSASNVLKTLVGFVLWDLAKTYTSLWPLLHLPLGATHEPLREPPFFGQSPAGAKAGIHGYPPRVASGHALSLPFSPLCQLVFPLIADGSRLVGLWFAFKTMRHIQSRGKARNHPAPARQWLAGGSQVLFLASFALPLAFVLLHQSFLDSACMQPFTGLMPLVGEQATAFAGLLLRCHSVFLGLAAAFTGFILAAAFHGIFQEKSKSKSAVLAAAASLAFCSCILFDVLAAAVPSSGISCTYTPFIADMRSGFVAVKAFAMAATLSHQVGQICLSLSAMTVKLREALEAPANPQEKKEA